jgi:hypothetical protein
MCRALLSCGETIRSRHAPLVVLTQDSASNDKYLTSRMSLYPPGERCTTYAAFHLANQDPTFHPPIESLPLSGALFGDGACFAIA